MLNWFKNLSIRSKLLALSVISAGIALSISCIGFVAADLRVLDDAKRGQLRSQAEMLSFNAGIVLTTQDLEAGKQLLAPIRDQSSLSAVGLYLDDGVLLTQYASTGEELFPETLDAIPGFRYANDGSMELLHEVVEAGQLVGWVLLRANMTDYWERRLNYLWIAGCVIVVSIVLTGVMSHWLQRPIAQPLRDLAAAALHISEHADLSVRVDYQSKDELGTLVTTFNSMISRIQEMEGALRKNKEELEIRVKERTAELEEEISQREIVQRDLVTARDAAESSNRAKSEFLANMSHEIRTPMTAILGFSEVLMNELEVKESSEERNAIETIRRNGEHLLAIINDILDLSKIEAGKMEIERIPCSPSQIVREVLSLMQVRASAKNIKLSARYDSPIPEFITSDPIRIRQILINLVGNAIKFTEKGSVTLVLSLANRETNPELLFDVIDTGIGISEHQIAKLFSAFEQGDTSMTRLYGGTGLGLAIGKKMANLLQGDLRVLSEVGKGSEFRLWLPAGDLTSVHWVHGAPGEGSHSAPTAIAPTTSGASFPGNKILVAEDGKDNQRLIRYLLQKMQIEPTIVENGREAIETAIAARTAGAPFDMILCDMQMPILDGYQAVPRLRQEGFSIPIIAVTAHAMNGDREKCVEIGCDDYLTKPIDRAALATLLKKYLGTPSAIFPSLDADSSSTLIANAI